MSVKGNGCFSFCVFCVHHIIIAYDLTGQLRRQKNKYAGNT